MEDQIQEDISQQRELVAECGECGEKMVWIIPPQWAVNIIGLIQFKCKCNNVFNSMPIWMPIPPEKTEQ